MNKLNIKKEGIYQIEVNDNGDIIEIDTLDIDTPLKFQKFYDDCMNLIEFVKSKDEEVKKMENKDLGVLSTQEVASLEWLKEYCIKGRKIVDMFFGDGAADSIFGKRNYITMFEDLMDALKPHFERIGLTQDKDGFNKAIEDKYADKDEATL